jgi:PAS domain S-box-containing protein
MANAWPKGGGTMGTLMRAYDWVGSPLGAPETWPASLRSVVSLLLESKFPMFVAWGPDLRFLYNDAYADMLGAKHPAAMGARFDEVWAESWPFVRRLVGAAMRREASWREDLPLIMNRYGHDEQAWLTFSYSPVEDDAGEVAGVFCAVVETTQWVRDQRARALLVELDDRVRDLQSADAILTVAVEMLGEQMGADRVHWAVVHPEQNSFDVRHEWTRPGTPGLLGDHRLSDFGQAMVNEMAANRIVAITDIREKPFATGDSVLDLFGRSLRGALAVPVARGGIWRAALCVHTREPRRWRDDERELVRDVAERVWARAERAAAEARVRESEKRFRGLVNATANVLFGMNADWTQLRQVNGQGVWSDAPISTRSWLEEHVPREDLPRIEAAIREAIAGKGPVQMEHPVRRRDGSLGWALTRAIPVLDAGGELVEWFGASTDVTEARRARQALEETAERLELATEAAEVGSWDLDVPNDVLVWTPRVKQMFGISAERPVSMVDFYGGLHPDDFERVAAAFTAALDPDRRASFDEEYRTIGKEDGRLRWVAARGRGMFNERGECVRVIGAALDITLRKAAEQHLRLMVNELNHRVKNSLATVQAIAAQTLRRGEVPDAVREALASRLIALAEAHDVLTDEKWSGAELADLASQAAAPYVSLRGVSPFYIDGPSVFLPPKTAIAMALAFHELATNAAKYGALSAPEGKVLIAWNVGETPGGRALRLTWRETGGPPVQAPVRNGFGTRLIQRGLASELNGEVKMDFQPAGLVCTVEALLPDEPIEGWMADLQLS